MVVKCQQEYLTDNFIEEVTPLLEEHRDELCLYDDFVLNPNWDAYSKLEEMGMFVIYTARCEGELVGYAAYAIHQNMHYSDKKHAVQDVLYIKPGRRGAMMGMKLLKFADDELIELGVNLVSHHSKVRNDIGPLLMKIGYHLAEYIYERRLG